MKSSLLTKIAALVGIALLLMPLGFAALQDLPSPFVVEGEYKAYIIVGAGAAVSDLIGAIDVAMAFAQRATTAEVGTAVLAVKSWAGTADRWANIGAGNANSDLIVNSTYVGEFANYEWAIDTTKYNATQEVTIVASEVNSTMLTLWLEKDSIKLVIESGRTDIYENDTIKILDTVYEVIDINDTDVFNVTIGKTDNDVRLYVGDSKTYAGITVTLLDISADEVLMRFEGGAEVVERVIAEGADYTYETLKVRVDYTFVGVEYKYATVDFIHSQIRIDDGAQSTFDTRYYWGIIDDGTLHNAEIAELDMKLNESASLAVGEILKGVGQLFDLEYKKHDVTGSIEWINITEAGAVANTISCTSTVAASGYLFHWGTGETAIPGETFYECTDGTAACATKVDVSGKVRGNVTAPSNTTVFSRLYGPGMVHDITIACLNGALTYYDKDGIAQTANFTTPSGLIVAPGQNKIYGPAININIGGTAWLGRDGTGKLVTGTQANETVTTSYFAKIAFSTDNVLTITEPDGGVLTVGVLFNATDLSAYIDSAKYPANETETAYKTYVGIPSAINETDQDGDSVRIKFPQHKLIYAVGAWTYEEETWSVGTEKTYPEANTTVKLTSVAGEIKYISPGMVAAFDTITPDRPLIIVGGACANALAAEALNVTMAWPDCAAGLEAGRALVKLGTAGGFDALVIAGYGADDTVLASRIVADYLISKAKGVSPIVDLTGTEVTLNTEAGTLTGVTIA
jgi:hypothetical protein